MLEVLFGILDIRHSKKRAHRILIVGDDALSCSTIAEHLSSIYDFKTTLVELESNSLDEQSDKISEQSVASGDIYIAKVPLECIFAEIRRRNWYKGCILDFFSPPGNEYNIDNVNNITVIPNAHVIIYITNYAKHRTGFNSASEFFLLNKDSMACKMLIMDTSNICDDIAVGCRARVS
uniref:Uncharacterized protein n=1 Tax=Babesia bovis TaxID=5865 RepID=Q95UH3_BABBO|nr:unknown [Babesia bovis]